MYPDKTDTGVVAVKSMKTVRARGGMSDVGP